MSTPTAAPAYWPYPHATVLEVDVREVIREFQGDEAARLFNARAVTRANVAFAERGIEPS